MNNKKKYIKPTFEFVDFSLSSSIAAACTLRPTHDEGVCFTGIDEGGSEVFNNAVCMDFPIDADVCYHVPLADFNVFAS